MLWPPEQIPDAASLPPSPHLYPYSTAGQSALWKMDSLVFSHSTRESGNLSRHVYVYFGEGCVTFPLADLPH